MSADAVHTWIDYEAHTETTVLMDDRGALFHLVLSTLGDATASAQKLASAQAEMVQRQEKTEAYAVSRGITPPPAMTLQEKKDKYAQQTGASLQSLPRLSA